MLELHYAPHTISVATAIALEEAGQAYRPVLVDFRATAQRDPAYLSLNPKGRVPTLIDGDRVLTETGAILEYVAPSLVPDDPWSAAKMRELMFYLASTMHVAHAHKMRGNRWADQAASHADMAAKVPQTMGDCCAYLETSLAFAPFAIGTRLTLADPYLFVVAGWAKGYGVDMESFPKLAAFMAMMRDRNSVKAVTGMGML